MVFPVVHMVLIGIRIYPVFKLFSWIGKLQLTYQLDLNVKLGRCIN